MTTDDALDNTMNKIFYAKTAQNFYNLSKGYWRPGTKKQRKQKIDH